MPPTPSIPRLHIRDFKDGARPSSETEVLKALHKGDPPRLYDHGDKKTPFSTWIAMRRSRLGKDFRYDNKVRVPDPSGALQIIDETLPQGQYYIWVV